MKFNYKLLLLFFGLFLGYTCSFYAKTSRSFQSDSLNLYLNKKLEAIFKASDDKKYDLTIELTSSLLQEASEANNYKYLFHGYNTLSITYDLLNDSIPSRDYAKKALHFAQLSQNDTLIAWGYNNLASSLATAPETRQEALDYYKKSLKIQERLKDGEFLDAALNIADLYKDEKNYAMMYPYLKQAQDSYDPAYFYYDDPLIYLEILWGNYYEGLNFDDKAYNHYNNAYNRIEETQLDYLALDFYDKFAVFLAKLNNNQRAYKVHQQYIEHFKEQERIKADETIQLAKALSEAEELKRERNEAKMKQQLLDQDLQRKNTQAILLASIIGLLILFLGYLFYSEKLRLRLIQDLKSSNRTLQKAKVRAETSERAKTKFFSTLSHEMRTPLYGVTGIISILDKNKAFTGFDEEISSLKFSAGHLLDIINDLLDLSKLEDESFSLIEKPFNIKTLVEDLISSFDQNSLKNSDCRLIYDIDYSVPNYIIGDSRRISQVLLNILSNALKFTPKGTIALRLKSKVVKSGIHELYFEVEDNGIGIPENKQDSIFEEFSQLDSFNPQSVKGTGLGLPIVRKLLQKMGSDITLKSEPGRGSMFSFSLNLKEATLLQVIGNGVSANKSNEQESSVDLKGSRILIVDDNKINRLVTRRILENLNATIFEATNGEEAIDSVKNTYFDLILMDINMEGINGFEATKIIREFNASIPVIALTAAEERYVNKKAQDSGMNDVVTKPFNVIEFTKILTEQIERYKSVTA